MQTLFSRDEAKEELPRAMSVDLPRGMMVCLWFLLPGLLFPVLTWILDFFIYGHGPGSWAWIHVYGERFMLALLSSFLSLIWLIVFVVWVIWKRGHIKFATGGIGGAVLLNLLLCWVALTDLGYKDLLLIFGTPIVGIVLYFSIKVHSARRQ
jgi:hypothetical protein